MTTHQGVFERPATVQYGASTEVPPAALEAAYYVHILYSTMAGDTGFTIPFAGLGFLMALAGYCAFRRGASLESATKLIRLPIAFALSFLFVRVLAHGDSVTAEYVREVPAWICGLIVAQSLAQRPGFVQRFPIAMLVIALPSLPHVGSLDMSIYTDNGIDVSRVGGGMGPLRNPNGLAIWFGFCCVFFAVLGLETRRYSLRVAAWVTAVGCLFVLGLTVSRGGLLAVAISVVIAFRRILNRGFVPLLLLLGAAWVAYSIGLFDRASASYAARGMEETGRLLVWPVAIDHFLESPLVGWSGVRIFVPAKNAVVTPHNGPIFICLSAGIVPFLLFMAYCMKSAASAWRAYRAQIPDAYFVLPLLVYQFITTQTTNVYFLDFSFIVTFACALQIGEPVVARLDAARRQVLGRYRSARPALQMPQPYRSR